MGGKLWTQARRNSGGRTAMNGHRGPQSHVGRSKRIRSVDSLKDLEKIFESLPIKNDTGFPEENPVSPGTAKLRQATIVA